MDLPELIRARAVIKTKLTKFNTYITKCKTDSTKRNQLTIRLQQAELLLSEFEKVQFQIEKGDNSETQIKEGDDFEELYYSSITEAQALLPTRVAYEVAGTSDRSNPLPITDHGASVRLPIIDLPKFDGSYEHWLSFRDIFQSVVDQNVNLSKVQKLHYLRSALTGTAAKITQALEISHDNYDIAWQVLKDRYENTKQIVHHHVQALMSLQSIQRESHEALQQLIDDVSQHLHVLERLKQPVKHWDTLLIHMIIPKLDHNTRREWEAERSLIEELPTWSELQTYLKKRCQFLQSLTAINQNNTNKSQIPTRNNNKPFTTKKLNVCQTYVTSNKSCPLCQGPHNLYQCNIFRTLTVDSRSKEVRRLKLCFNCLRPYHGRDCKAGSCKKCKRFHHSLLHADNSSVSDPAANGADNNQIEIPTQSRSVHEGTPNSNHPACSVVNASHSQYNSGQSQILLSTALVIIHDADGRPHTCRALLDNGSQANFITEELANRLKLPKKSISTQINGISQTVAYANKQIYATIASRCNSYRAKLPFLTVQHIADNLPQRKMNIREFKIPENITLADPTFNVPGTIDILIGASLFFELLCIGQIKPSKHLPLLQKTKLGWILSGRISTYEQSRQENTAQCYFLRNLDIQDQLELFWKIEELPGARHLSPDDKACEEQFKETYSRKPDGRFIVQLPLNGDADTLGNSCDNAMKRLISVEKRLERQPELKREYHLFLQDYLALSHMTEVPTEEAAELNSYYLPHHPVVKTESTTTKVRVVFDASCKPTTGNSLNDILAVGPTIQPDLLSILIRFRQHQYVISADVKQMYRQIQIHPNQRHLQTILWRWSTDEPIRTFQLNTLTYGTASAAYLAIRCLQQTALDHQREFPEASQAILNDFYVDDLLTGGIDIEQVTQLKGDITHVVETGKFELRKWRSNEQSIVDQSTEDSTVSLGDPSKTLGLVWNTQTDTLQYRVIPFTERVQSSKRGILSAVSQIFDPLGLLGPGIVQTKILLQQLWKLQLSWDESLPIDLHTMWTRWHHEMHLFNEIVIPRKIVCHQPVDIQVHGFSDASEAAYGACVYLRSTDCHGETHMHLLCSKSRVAPLKNLSLPRLELCGALLLAKLCSKILNSLTLTINKIYLWCDSTVTLSWIKGEPYQWNTFVANRVSEIHQITTKERWQHIPSGKNPADLVSRGISPQQLKTCSLWWNGPDFLCDDETTWPIPMEIHLQEDEVPEARKRVITMNLNTMSNPFFDIFRKFSCLSRLKRIIAYCLRFKVNALNPALRQTGPLTAHELDDSMICLVRLAQREEFLQELNDLQSKRQLHNKSRIRSLHPFIDNNGLIRVGGRLKNAPISFSHKYPLVLADKHPLTLLLVRHEHLRSLHSGPQALLAHIRTTYWPLHGKGLIRKVLHRCTVCFRARPTSSQQLMGDLPSQRVTPSRAFLNAGVDYAGPFSIKISRNKTGKAYMCIFVCFATKAVHIELVSDLTTAAFLNALKRFVARRGKCHTLHSDNGTNFVGANNELKEIYTAAKQALQTDECKNFLAEQSITWNFIPPLSPHVGGLWEAAVKSAKTHLRKVVGSVLLTFEELYTVLTEIEACLNSRPLVPMSDDPTDLAVLTPGHFLIGAPLLSIPERNVADLPMNRCTRYELLSRIRQHFWTRWVREYLSQLQQRPKWQSVHYPKLQPGVLVVLRDENQPPMKWLLGRVIETHPGSDGLVRIVTVKTKNGIVKRSLPKICVLPLDSKCDT